VVVAVAVAAVLVLVMALPAGCCKRAAWSTARTSSPKHKGR
jgi:hypothetical protein